MTIINCDMCKKELNDNSVDHKYWGKSTLCEECYNKVEKSAKEEIRNEKNFDFNTYNERIRKRIK